MNDYKIGDKVEIINIGVFNTGFVKVGDIATFMDKSTLSCPTWKDTQVIYEQCMPVYIKPYVEPEAVTPNIKFPCCVPTSGIRDAEALLALVALFEANGATVYDGIDCGGGHEFDRVDNWNYFGVSLRAGGNTFRTDFYDDLEDYDQSDNPSKIAVYSVAELLGLVAKGGPVAEVPPLLALFAIGTEVKIAKDSKFYRCGDEYSPPNTKGRVAGNSSIDGDEFCYLVKWDNGTRNSYRLNDLVLWDENTSVASQEAITDVSDSKPGVGIDSDTSGYKEPTEPLMSIVKDVKYTVTIKGIDFTFTQDQVNDLVSGLEGFVDYD